MLLTMTYCGYLIQSYPVIEMIGTPMKRYFEGSNKCVLLMLDYAIRYAVAMVAFGFAYLIPTFKNIIPFVGVTMGMTLALFFPPLLETIVFIDQWRNESIVKLIYAVTLNICYILIGMSSAIIGVYSNYQVLIERPV
ncbi:hypothetical protein NECAME_12490 [Necator americanus]|uniref:Amino acid transporter transmembrane domain-containing protein n=1 Tax=Necator americanus TaxID=51031 RepID=W2SZY1_NECAM|nr:hypothetical protein NECAME_12490 [Necator americanus]ETN75300.1 hypothetical protein NECAME_12490 [Necator americanus]